MKQSKNKIQGLDYAPDPDFFVASGMATIIPGLQFAIDRMQDLLDNIRLQLRDYQSAQAAQASESARTAVAQLRRRGKPPGSKGTRNGWPADPAARSREMKRRMAVARAHKAGAAKLHPRDPRHPGHAAWLEKVSKAARKRWAQLSPEGRASHLAKMQAGRAA